jgi:hypothetical protein
VALVKVVDPLRRTAFMVGVSGTLRLGPGERRGAFRVTIIDDNRPELHEDLLLVLRQPSRPAALGTPNLGFIRIRASDADARR